MSSIRRILGTPALLRRLALASLVANIVLVGTGGAVRLTGSGLGCPTWPRCTDASYTTTAAMGVHGVIEFGNRTLTFVVGLLALACVLAALCQRPRSRPLTLWSVLVLAQIPAQAVIGGITVLTNLNPWVVGLHFLASMAVIAAAYQLWVRTGGAPAGAALARPLSALARLTAVVAVAVLAVGTVVTGSGPHAGDAGARRTGLDPQEMSQLHADLVFLLLGLSVALWYALRAVGAPDRVRRAAAWLIWTELAQGAIGFVQYFTHLPALAVGLHMVGAAVVWVAALAVLEAARPAPVTAGAPAGAAVPARKPTDASGSLPPALARPRS
ncbi:COX15/CtaA family protein [Planosporangium sp. 12N6]|uniref:COX15/CtaA family protein n=1 Tax=Planosporangium spinosum TaxID=3402278 RepID=UPI003CE8E378